MNSPSESKLTGINIWFVIEIFSFYGYILSAIAFILFHSLKSSFSSVKYECFKDRYKYDFLAYHKKDLDWLAFVTILLNVNLGLICIDDYILYPPGKREGKHFPLRGIMLQLMCNHLLQMVFLRDFYDENRKVNTKNQWVWYVHIVSYAYIIYMYCFTGIAMDGDSEASKIWVPLDIILTFNISMYQLFYLYEEKMENSDIVDPKPNMNILHEDESN